MLLSWINTCDSVRQKNEHYELHQIYCITVFDCDDTRHVLLLHLFLCLHFVLLFFFCFFSLINQYRQNVLMFSSLKCPDHRNDGQLVIVSGIILCHSFSFRSCTVCYIINNRKLCTIRSLHCILKLIKARMFFTCMVELFIHKHFQVNIS